MSTSDPTSRPGIPGGPQSVAAILDRALRETPEREALVGSHARYTYAELDREVDRAALGPRGAGLLAGDRIAASLGNHTEIVVAFFAAMRLGLIWVGVNRILAPREKAFPDLSGCRRRELSAAAAVAFSRALRPGGPAQVRPDRGALLGHAAASAEALRGGKLHTGDLGYLDQEDQLLWVDRKADTIVRGGANVYAAEVERVLREEPQVADCAVMVFERIERSSESA